MKVTRGMGMGVWIWLSPTFLHNWPCRFNSPGNAVRRSPGMAPHKNPGLGPTAASSFTPAAPLLKAPLLCLQGQLLSLKLMVTTHLNSVSSNVHVPGVAKLSRSVQAQRKVHDKLARAVWERQQGTHSDSPAALTKLGKGWPHFSLSWAQNTILGLRGMRVSGKD